MLAPAPPVGEITPRDGGTSLAPATYQGITSHTSTTPPHPGSIQAQSREANGGWRERSWEERSWEERSWVEGSWVERSWVGTREEKEMLGAERRVPSSPMAAARPRNTDAL